MNRNRENSIGGVNNNRISQYTISRERGATMMGLNAEIDPMD